MNTDWYKDAVIYQIWPRSFCDGNGDGIGDLYGVYSKLDYIKSLGVDAIWFSPLYPSPNFDFGYDVSDYRAINPEYGDLEIFRRVLDGAHERGMRVIMDLVINHSSTEHEWFRLGRDRSDPHHDYYFWREPRGAAAARAPSRTTGTASSAAAPGSTTSSWASTTCTSLQSSRPTSTTTTPPCAAKSRT